MHTEATERIWWRTPKTPKRRKPASGGTTSGTRHILRDPTWVIGCKQTRKKKQETKERWEYLWALPDNVSVWALSVLAEVCGSDECHGAELAGVGPNTHFSSALSNRKQLGNQCWGSVTFLCGSGSRDPYLWLSDPDSNPFFSDLKNANYFSS